MCLYLLRTSPPPCALPFRICFSAEADGQIWYFEVAISVFFIVDVLLNFNTAFAIDDKWIIVRHRIWMRYLTGMCRMEET